MFGFGAGVSLSFGGCERAPSSVPPLRGQELISFGNNGHGERDLPQELRAAGWTRGANRQQLRPSVEVLQVAA
eukprot:5446703-Amphidinium_carterae.1